MAAAIVSTVPTQGSTAEEPAVCGSPAASESTKMTVEQARHETILTCLKARTPAGMWFNASTKMGQDFSLVGALHIAGLNDPRVLRKWLSKEGVLRSKHDGHKGIFVRKYGSNVVIAHGSMPKMMINFQSSDSLLLPLSDSQLDPLIPSDLMKPTNTSTSVSEVPILKRDVEEEEMELKAAESLLNGDCVGEICVNGVMIKLDVNDSGPLSVLQHTAMTILLNKSAANYRSNDGAGDTGQNCSLVPYRRNLTQQSTAYLLPVSKWRKDSVLQRSVKRKADELSRFMDVTVGPNPELQAKVTSQYLKNNELVLYETKKALLKYNLTGRISADTIAVELVGKGCFDFQQIKVLKDLTDAIGVPLIGSLKAIRQSASKPSCLIPTATGTADLICKKNAHASTKVPFLRAISLKQAVQVLIHVALNRGCQSPAGVPAGELWVKGLGDAGGSRFLYALQPVLELVEDGIRTVLVNSIKNTTIVGVFSTEKAGDNAENLSRALFSYWKTDLNFLSSMEVNVAQINVDGSYVASAFVRDKPECSFSPTLLVAVVEDGDLDTLSKSHQTFELMAGDMVVLLLNSIGQVAGVASIAFTHHVQVPTFILEHSLDFLSSTSSPIEQMNVDAHVQPVVRSLPRASPRHSLFTRIIQVDLNLAFPNGPSDVVVASGLFEFTGLCLFPSPSVKMWDNLRSYLLSTGHTSAVVRTGRVMEVTLDERLLRKWEGGDLEYFGHLEGTQATGKRPCYLCNMPTDFFSCKCGQPCPDSEERTLENLTQHAEQLSSDTTEWYNGTLGRQNGVHRKGQKPSPIDYDSVVRRPQWDFEPFLLALPFLHIELFVPLGWWRGLLVKLRLLDGLEKEDVERLDAFECVLEQLEEMKEISTDLAKVKIPEAKKDMDENKEKVRRLLRLADKAPLGLKNAKNMAGKRADGVEKTKIVAGIGIWEQCTHDHDNNTKELKEVNALIKDMEGLKAEMESESSSYRGKFETAAMTTLEQRRNQGGCGIQLTKHFGGSFTGNDCKKLTESLSDGTFMFDRLIDCALSMVREERHHSADDVKWWEDELGRYRSLMLEWSQISKIMHVTRKLEEHEIQFLETRCAPFVDAYQDLLGESKATKLHIIKKHLAPFARKFNVLYLLCEEAIEAKHARWNRYARQMARVMDGEKRFSLMAELDALNLSDVKSDAANAIRNMKAQRARGPYKKRDA